jgi:hypothetical protein
MYTPGVGNSEFSQEFWHWTSHSFLMILFYVFRRFELLFYIDFSNWYFPVNRLWWKIWLHLAYICREELYHLVDVYELSNRKLILPPSGLILPTS